MHTLLGNPGRFADIDSAVSDTAKELRSNVQLAIDPPGTSRQVRRAEMKRTLWSDVLEFIRKSDDSTAINRLLSTVIWSEQFIDAELATLSAPDIAVDADGEVLFEWLRGPREVLTVSIGPAGVVNFASLASGARFHGVTRIGTRAPSPFRACLEQVGAASGD
jgi:hypothetical protein